MMMVLGCANATVTNLFPNGGFDAPAGTNTPWVEVFGGGTTTYSYPTSGGNPAGYGRMNNASGWGIWVGGEPTPLPLVSYGLVAGGTYTFVMDMKNFSGTGIGKLKIESWAGGVFLGDTGDISAGSQSAAWATYSFPVTLNAAATGIKVVPVAGNLSQIGYDNIGVIVSNSPLAVSITSPANNSLVTSNYSIDVQATVNPGTVTNVNFYDGATLLGNDTTFPYSYAVTGGTSGTHTLKAVARDSNGNSATSSVVSITVSNLPPLVGWQLVWNDEFSQADGTSPDSSKWGYELGGGGWGNSELENYTSRTNNARILGGQLVIEARAESYGGNSYTSARLLTKGKWSWTYGRMEARIKIPRGQGIWPAFWMLGTNIDSVSWPACGEIDIMENIGKEPTLVHGTIHGPGYSGANGIGGPCSLANNAAFADDFHLYAVEWTTNQIKWFVDGQQFFSMTPASLPAGTTWVYTQPQFLLLNVAVGGQWPGNPDGTTTFPQQMLVDFVRVYKYVPNAPDAPTGLSVSPGNNKVYLNWDASSSGVTGYNVKRATTSGGSYTTVGSSATNSFTDTGAANCTTFYYVVTATNSVGESTISSEKVAAQGAFALAVNTGGSAAGQFAADAYFTGGTQAAPASSVIDTSGVTNPAPQAVYQTERYGTFTYTFGGLTPGVSFKVRLHFVEYYWTSANARTFNVTINGTQVLTNYDIFAAAGGQNRAIVREFASTPNGNGQIVVAYTAGAVDQPKSSGIEILLPQPAAPVAGNNGPIWSGMTLNLTASTVPGATYSWTGPNGFSSTNQNPAILKASTNAAGLFSVTAVMGGCASVPATTTVTVNPPASVSVQASARNVILSWLGGTLQSATNVSGPWVDVSGATSPRTNPAAAAQGFYRLRLQ